MTVLFLSGNIIIHLLKNVKYQKVTGCHIFLLSVRRGLQVYAVLPHRHCRHADRTGETGSLAAQGFIFAHTVLFPGTGGFLPVKVRQERPDRMPQLRGGGVLRQDSGEIGCVGIQMIMDQIHWKNSSLFGSGGCLLSGNIINPSAPDYQTLFYSVLGRY
ncbi:MAG: hypothetical protein ACI4PC_04255 [Oscillospiraceae bacterium]